LKRKRSLQLKKVVPQEGDSGPLEERVGLRGGIGANHSSQTAEVLVHKEELPLQDLAYLSAEWPGEKKHKRKEENLSKGSFFIR